MVLLCLAQPHTILRKLTTEKWSIASLRLADRPRVNSPDTCQ
ncbi:RPM1-interacting protein 4 (RIN4) family protein [Zea mays]|uniref:RPM1-interacting protein 4 (RIN4) family protein n=1 Tax=Zea mays TaxID=4577 RepID=A0A1D6Q8X0_MAIZE|nr:RPM1-interacting protein 4 (RIN4) family protein [Zea mays]